MYVRTENDIVFITLEHDNKCVNVVVVVFFFPLRAYYLTDNKRLTEAII